MLTHGNILANLEPIEREIERYRRYERFVHPLRFLDLLPLSHVFGQLLGIFIPQILGATSVFSDTLNPSEIVAHHSRRARFGAGHRAAADRIAARIRSSAILRPQAVSKNFVADFEAGEGEHFLKRWWRFRAIHRRLRLEILGRSFPAAPRLPAEAEQFWSRLGYAVIQGYGLTETTSLVSVNHPFRLGRGSIGKALPGLEVKLAEDGEILVRGGKCGVAAIGRMRGVTPRVRARTAGFTPATSASATPAGNLYFKGRSKNVIVTPEGLNVYPARSGSGAAQGA